MALDGNAAGANLIQEAKNGRKKCHIFVSSRCRVLKEKTRALKGYVRLFEPGDTVAEEIIRLVKTL